VLNGFKIIGVCISRLESTRHFEFISKLNAMAVKQGYRLFIYHTHSDLYNDSLRCKGEKSIFELIDYTVVDVGLIFEEAFSSKTIVEELIEGFNKKDVPVMVVGKIHENAISYTFDYEQGFEAVVRHIIEHHKVKSNIVFIAGRKGDDYSNVRLDIFKKVCSENKITDNEIRLYYGDYWYGPTKAAIKEIITSGKIPKAVICANDSMAIAAMEEFSAHGINVPNDVIVSGFDGIPASMTCNPPLTTSKCSFDKVVLSVMHGITDVTNGNTVEKVNYIDFKTDVRASCGCKKDYRDFTIGSLLRKSEERTENFLFTDYSLHVLTEKLTFVSDEQEFIKVLQEHEFYDMSVILQGCALDESRAPNMMGNMSPEDMYGDPSYLLLDTERKDRQYPVKVDSGDNNVVKEDVIRILNSGNPLIISSISALGERFGILLFYFDVDQISYNRILQYSNFITRALINWRNNRYMKYVAKSNERMSNHDYMTDLYNRKGFFKRLPVVIERARNHGERILVANFDVNGLKVINDKYGHEAGDFVIASVGKVILNLPYEVKACARFGGDEFAFCTSVKSPNKFVFSTKQIEQKFMEDVEAALAKANETSNQPFKLAASVGVVIAEVRNFDFNKSYRIADVKMYRMKLRRRGKRK